MSSGFSQAGWANESFHNDNSGRLIVLFHPFQKLMELKSKNAGRPIYEERIFITKIVPGDKGHVIDRPMREEDKLEFPIEWARWEQTRENKVVGFPIENWPALSDTQKLEFKGMKIQTVEQFANLSDGIVQGIMGGSDLRKKARVFVESGKDAEIIGQIRAEAEARESALKAEMAEMRAMLEKLTAPSEGGKHDKREKVTA